MEDWESEAMKDFVREMERGVAALPAEQRGEVYRPCAVNCVKDRVYTELKRQFDECGGDLDAQYTKYGRSEYFFADIVEKGHVYELGYPRCLCPLIAAGCSLDAGHCECSRQSILYVLKRLLPDKQIRVEPLTTVLDGGKECRFRATVE